MNATAILTQILNEVIALNNPDMVIDDKYIIYSGEIQNILRHYIHEVTEE